MTMAADDMSRLSASGFISHAITMPTPTGRAGQRYRYQARAAYIYVGERSPTRLKGRVSLRFRDSRFDADDAAGRQPSVARRCLRPALIFR